MSEEEKKAIDNFKSEYDSCNYNNSDLIIELECAKILLNLIEKQQAEIEKDKAIMNEMAKDLMQFVKEPVLLPNEIIKEYTKEVERNYE